MKRTTLIHHVLAAALMSWTLYGCQSAPPPALQIGLNFTASTLGVDTQTTLPADTTGAVGAHHLVELINGRYSVYRKSDGTLVESRVQEQFWRDTGAGPINITLDSRVVFDPSSQRWFATGAHVATPDNRNTILLAVSRSTDPTEGWTGFSMLSDPHPERLGDFPSIGVDADGIYIRAGIRDSEVCVQVIVVVPKADLLASTPTVANASVLGDMECFGGLSATFDLDNTGLPFYLIQSEAQVGKATLVSITGTVRAPAITRQEIPVAAHPFAPPGEQPPAPAQKPGVRVFPSITAGSILRDGVIWSVETVGHENRAALRWLEVDAKQATLLQEGLISDPALHFYNASIAVNELGNVVIGFNGSSASQFISVYAVAGATDASGVTTFGEPTLVKAGVDDYAGANWGDYSATVADPVDPSRFWTFQEWVSGDDVFSTQITEIIVDVARPSWLRRLWASWRSLLGGR